MEKEIVLKKEDFIKAGFKASYEDFMFPFSKQLVSKEEIKANELEEEEIPYLLFGNSGLNKGFCIYTGEHFVWINVTTPAEAVEFASKIISFEPV